MRVFVTGASGWIGSAVIPELLTAGHDVLGLARSDASAATVAGAGAEVARGSLDDLDSLRAGVAATDGVIHLAFNHDFSDYASAGRLERAAVEAIGDALAGSDRPFLLASGVAIIAAGRVATEKDESPMIGPESLRGGSERLALDYVDRGVRSVALRFAPTVHGPGDHGFIATLVDVARDKGSSAYIGDGANRWPAVHRLDAARLVALALESAPAGTVVHAVAEEGVPTREIARSSAGSSAYRLSRSLRKMLLIISAGSRASLPSMRQRRATSPASCSAGRRSTRRSSTTSRPVRTSPSTRARARRHRNHVG